MAKVKDETSSLQRGSVIEFRRVDEVQDENSGQWTIRDSTAAAKPKQDKSDKFAQYCFTIHRKFPERSSGRKNKQRKGDPKEPPLTTIEIKSAELRRVLEEILGEVAGLSWNAAPLRLDPQILLTAFDELQAYLSKHSDPDVQVNGNGHATGSADITHFDSNHAHAALSLLVDFLQEDYGSQLEELQNLLSHGEITFELAWAAYKPRAIVVTHDGPTGEPRAYRLQSAALTAQPFGPPAWELSCVYLEMAGDFESAEPQTTFGLAEETLFVPFFKGRVKMRALKVFPLCWHPKEAELRAKLVERGRKWAGLDGVHHVYYNGTAHIQKDRRTVKTNVRSRIMIDKGQFRRVNPGYQVGEFSSEVDEHEEVEKDVVPSDNELLLASPILYGFSLSDKLWLEFNVCHVSPIEWNDAAFENLVLPPGQKQLIQSLVESHGKNNFDDFVKGKGKGLVVNLFGPPGVGKTLSAEATSEYVRKPLYVVGAGDLGADEHTLNYELGRVFDVVAAWQAIVLIDEADVFLEQRTIKDLHRNAMVSVFLRHLEYYEGILFLTTNRVSTFDEAFISRIHIALHYRDLSPETKAQIWAAFLKTVDVKLDEEHLHILANRELNGREIKNCVRTANSLAGSRGEKLRFEHMVEVMEVMEQFNADFKKLTRGGCA